MKYDSYQIELLYPKIVLFFFAFTTGLIWFGGGIKWFQLPPDHNCRGSNALYYLLESEGGKKVKKNEKKLCGVNYIEIV
jgi:hypothetical protein